jgi:hypothetical protein
MRKELEKILSNVNDWLKFAETKNAGLLVFNSAAVAGILQSYKVTETNLVLFKGMMLVGFMVSICISLYTFLPVLDKTFTYRKIDEAEFERQKDALNCYFFKHHSQINCQQLLVLIKHKAGNPMETHTTIDQDIADQIINNAEIAVSKFRLFTWAAYITFAGVVMALAMILSQLFH